jgi:hypothetical protein
MRPAREIAWLISGNFCPGRTFWHNRRLSAARPTFIGCLRVGHTREVKPDPGILPGSLNCSVTHTGEIA